MVQTDPRDPRVQPIRKQVLLRVAADLKVVGEKIAAVKQHCEDQMRLLGEAAEIAAAIRPSAARQDASSPVFEALVREMAVLHDGVRGQVLALRGIAGTFLNIARDVEADVARLQGRLRDPKEAAGLGNDSGPAIVPLSPYRIARAEASAARAEAEEMSRALRWLQDALGEMSAAQAASCAAVAALHQRMEGCRATFPAAPG